MSYQSFDNSLIYSRQLNGLWAEKLLIANTIYTRSRQACGFISPYNVYSGYLLDRFRYTAPTQKDHDLFPPHLINLHLNIPLLPALTCRQVNKHQLSQLCLKKTRLQFLPLPSFAGCLWATWHSFSLCKGRC